MRVPDLQKFPTVPSSEWRWRLSSCPPYSAVGSSGGVPPGSAAVHPRGVSRRCPRRNGRRDDPRRPVLTVFHIKNIGKKKSNSQHFKKTRKTTPCWRCKWHQYWIQRTSAILVSAWVEHESSCCHLVQHDSAPNIVSGVIGVLSINCLDLPFQAGNFESGCLRLVDLSQTGTCWSGKCVWRLGDKIVKSLKDKRKVSKIVENKKTSMT